MAKKIPMSFMDGPLGVIFSIVQNWPDHPPVQRNSSSPCPISTRGTDYAPGSSDLPTALYICMVTRSGRFYATYFRSTKVTTIQIPYFLNNILP